eukprot:1157158-Rhodomonas_salina.1
MPWRIGRWESGPATAATPLPPLTPWPRARKTPSSAGETRSEPRPLPTRRAPPSRTHPTLAAVPGTASAGRTRNPAVSQGGSPGLSRALP